MKAPNEEQEDTIHAILKYLYTGKLDVYEPEEQENCEFYHFTLVFVMAIRCELFDLADLAQDTLHERQCGELGKTECDLELLVEVVYTLPRVYGMPVGNRYESFKKMVLQCQAKKITMMDRNDLKNLASQFPDFTLDLIDALRAREELKADDKGVDGDEWVDVAVGV